MSVLFSTGLGALFCYGAWNSHFTPVQDRQEWDGSHKEAFALAMGVACVFLAVQAAAGALLTTRVALIVMTIADVLITGAALGTTVVFVIGLPGWWKLTVLAPVAVIALIWLLLIFGWRGHIGHLRGTHDEHGNHLDHADAVKEWLRVVSPRQLPLPVDPRLKLWAFAPIGVGLLFLAASWVVIAPAEYWFEVPMIMIGYPVALLLFTLGLASMSMLEAEFRASRDPLYSALFWVGAPVLGAGLIAMIREEYTGVEKVFMVLPVIWVALIIASWIVHVRTRRAAYARIVAEFDPNDYGPGSSFWY